MKTEEIDLLENYHLLPEPVQAILLDFNEDADNLYSECKETIQKLKEHGYAADYDLSGTLFNLKRIDAEEKEIQRKKDKQYQFVKLTAALTKQGFKFDRKKDDPFMLVFDKVSAERLWYPGTRLPFVDSLIKISSNKNTDRYRFNQWAERKIK